VAYVLPLLAHSTTYCYCSALSFCSTYCRYFQVPRRLIDMAEQQVREVVAGSLMADLFLFTTYGLYCRLDP